MAAAMLKPPAGARKARKIVGRGSSSGHGGTSTRGNKGQNARSGGGVRPGFEGGQMPLFRRIARRGFSNARFRKVYRVVRLGQLARVYGQGDAVSEESLREKGLVKGPGPVKLVAGGEVPRGVKVELAAVSRAARSKIEEAGGTVVERSQGPSRGGRRE